MVRPPAGNTPVIAHPRRQVNRVADTLRQLGHKQLRLVEYDVAIVQQRLGRKRSRPWSPADRMVVKVLDRVDLQAMVCHSKIVV